MTNDQFLQVLDYKMNACRSTLNAKGAVYSPDDVRHANFNVAAALQGITPAQALWGMAAKHIVATSGFVAAGIDKISIAEWGEKIGDTINYLLLLYAMVIEQKNMLENICHVDQ